MDWPYLHLITNHFPVVLTVLGTAAALAALILRRRGPWMYAVATLAFAGAASLPAFVTGNQAEEVVEDRPGIAARALEAHEESGETALWILLSMGAVSALAWWQANRDPTRAVAPSWLRGLVVTAALAGTIAVTYTGWQGGKILHGSQVDRSPDGREGGRDRATEN